MDLALRDHLCVFPVTGWWRERPGLKRVESRARYALVIGLETPGMEVDLYTPISTVVGVGVAAAREIKI